MVCNAVRQHGLFQRHQHADVAGRRIHRADEHDRKDQRNVSGIRQRQAGRRHDQCADQEEATQIVAGREQAHRQRHDRRSKQRNRGNNPDLKWAEADFGQVGRQNDDGESVAEAASRARRVQENDLCSPGQRRFLHLAGCLHHNRINRPASQ